jgi:acylphosphatase
VAGDLGGNFISNPAVARNSDGRLEVFVVGADHALYHNFQQTAGSTSSWSGFTKLGGFILSDPAVGKNRDGRLEVFVVGSNNELYHNFEQAASNSNSWSGFVSLGGNIISVWSDGFETPYTMTQDGTISPNGKWFDVYGGYGLKGVTRQTLPSGGTNGFFYEYPKTSTSPGESHATLTTSTTPFKDFQMTLFMKTVKQLRQNSPPNTWETAWVFWHYTDEFHNYALVLKTNGFQIEKKDNNVGCDCEIYLKTTSTPTVHLGQWQKLTLRVTNSAFNKPHIQVWVDGLIAADFVDNTVHQPNSPRLGA